MIKADQYYIENLKMIRDFGTMDENPRPKYKDGTPAHSKFIVGSYEEYDISNGEYPITTLRNTAIKMGISEILWIYQKQSNSLKLAREMGIYWWDDWNIGDDTIGERYGYTIKKYNLMDSLLNSLKNDPFSRRHIIDMYQYTDLSGPGLYPCAYSTIWSVRKLKNKYYLDLTLFQRSNDYIVAGYINKIQYVALLMMVSGHLGYEPGYFRHFVQNLHIYDRHLDALSEIINRDPINIQPRLELIENKNFYDYNLDDFKIIGTEKIKKLNSSLELAI